MGCTVSSNAVAALSSKRGKTYNPELDPLVTTIYDRMGNDVLKKCCKEFYSRVQKDDEMPSFRESFSTPPERASELLHLFFSEIWGGPKEYTKLRSSCFPFLRSIHRLWHFQLTKDNWDRWFYHWKGAMTTYKVDDKTQEAAMYSLYRMREWIDPEESVYKQMFEHPGEFDADIKAAKNHHEEKSEEKYKKNDDKK